MKYKAIVSDWNGTLFYDATDESIHREFAYKLFRSRLKRLLTHDTKRLKEFLELLESAYKIRRGYAEYNKVRSKQDIDLNKKIEEMKRIANEIYEIFNKNILIGRSVEFVNDVIDEYAIKNKNKVDNRIATPIQHFHSRGKSAYVISGSYQDCIQKILELSGYSSAFDEIIGTKFKEYCGIVTNIDESSRKGKTNLFIKRFFDELGYREHDIIYFGDMEFELRIGEMLPRGNFIVPFLADENFKELASRYCGAFVPESEEDLMKYLSSKA